MSVCESASKSSFRDLSTRHDWPVQKSIHSFFHSFLLVNPNLQFYILTASLPTNSKGQTRWAVSIQKTKYALRIVFNYILLFDQPIGLKGNSNCRGQMTSATHLAKRNYGIFENAKRGLKKQNFCHFRVLKLMDPSSFKKSCYIIKIILQIRGNQQGIRWSRDKIKLLAC